MGGHEIFCTLCTDVKTFFFRGGGHEICHTLCKDVQMLCQEERWARNTPHLVYGYTNVLPRGKVGTKLCPANRMPIGWL